MATTQSGMPDRVLQPASLSRWLNDLDHAGFWLQELPRAALLSASFALAYAVFTAFGYAMARTLGDFVAFWPAAGLLGGVMVCTPLRTWPLWIAAAYAGRWLADVALLDEYPLGITMAFGTASAVEALVFAAFMTKPLEQSFRLGRPLYLMTAFCVMALAGSAAGALLGAGTLAGSGITEPFWDIWRRRMVGDYLGLVIVGPMIAWLLLPQIRIRRPRRSALEYLAWAVLLLAVAALAAGSTGSRSTLMPGAIQVLVAVPLIWAALRFAYPFVALGLFATAIAINWYTSQSAIALAAWQLDQFAADASLQLYLVVVTQLVLFVAYTVLERERADIELGVHRRLERVLVSLSNELIRVDAARMDAVIDNSLREIGRFARADRCLLFQITADGESVAETHGWYGPRGGAVKKVEQEVAIADFPWALSMLQKKGYFALDNLPAAAPAEFRPLQERLPPSTSILYLGLFTDGVLTGCIGLDWRDGHSGFSRESRALLYLVGQLFANILKRINAESTVAGYQSKLRSMAREIARGEERVRRRAAVDVHDGVGQNLAVARMLIGQSLAAARYDEKSLCEARDLIDNALRSTRHVIADLSPAILYELGLVPAIRSLAERFEPTNNVRCSVAESGEPWPLGDDLLVELYRVVRELLANVAKHARAGNVGIRVDWAADGIGIVVEDDGIGFKSGAGGPSGVAFAGFGLFSVREGVALLGGRVDVDASPGIGTVVGIHVPRPGGAS